MAQKQTKNPYFTAAKIMAISGLAMIGGSFAGIAFNEAAREDKTAPLVQKAINIGPLKTVAIGPSEAQINLMLLGFGGGAVLGVSALAGTAGILRGDKRQPPKP